MLHIMDYDSMLHLQKGYMDDKHKVKWWDGQVVFAFGMNKGRRWRRLQKCTDNTNTWCALSSAQEIRGD